MPAEGIPPLLSRSAQPARVPIVAVSSSSPARSSWRVSRSNFDRRGSSGRQERLLAVQHRRVRARRVVGALDLAGPQVELDAAEQGRVRVGVEVGIGQVRDLARMAVELDQVGALDLAEVGAGAALVDAEQRVEGLQGGAVDVQGVGQELADGRSAAGVIDRVGVAGPEQQVVGPSAAVGIAAEERSDVPPETDREGRDRRPAAEPAEGQADENVLGAAQGDRLPRLRPGRVRPQPNRSGKNLRTGVRSTGEFIGWDDDRAANNRGEHPSDRDRDIEEKGRDEPACCFREWRLSAGRAR